MNNPPCQIWTTFDCNTPWVGVCHERKLNNDAVEYVRRDVANAAVSYALKEAIGMLDEIADNMMKSTEYDVAYGLKTAATTIQNVMEHNSNA